MINGSTKMNRKHFLMGGFVAVVAVLFMGCPRHDHEHPEITGKWQRVSPEDAHLFEEEQIHFTETEVYYFGAFGGPNTMLPAKHEGHFDLYPVFKGTYVIEESVEPHTIDFSWNHYWPDAHEDAEFEPFTQLGIWDTLVDRHGAHKHILLYINFGDSRNRPSDWPGEIKFERIDDGHDHDHQHDHH